MDPTPLEELVRRLRLIVIATLTSPDTPLDREERAELSVVIGDLVDGLTTTLFGKDYTPRP